MRNNNRTLFRQKAWDAYVSKQEQTVLPRFVTPPVFVFLWLFCGLLLVAGGLAWWIEVPTYTAGSGILLQQPGALPSGKTEVMALIFLPASHVLSLQKGTAIQLQIDQSGSSGSGRIERVEPGLVSPQEARERYTLTGAAALLITRPSMVVFASVPPPLSAPLYVGSLVSTQVPIGTQHLLPLLFGPHN